MSSALRSVAPWRSHSNLLRTASSGVATFGGQPRRDLDGLGPEQTTSIEHVACGEPEVHLVGSIGGHWNQSCQLRDQGRDARPADRVSGPG